MIDGAKSLDNIKSLDSAEYLDGTESLDIVESSDNAEYLDGAHDVLLETRVSLVEEYRDGHGTLEGSLFEKLVLTL